MASAKREKIHWYKGGEKALTMPSNIANQDWMTATEAALYLRIKRRELLRQVRNGNIPAYALSGTKRRVYRFRREDLDSALLSRPVVCCDSSREESLMTRQKKSEDRSYSTAFVPRGISSGLRMD